MTEIIDILPNFKNLHEYQEFLNSLVEKGPSGEEVSRGMDKHDKSKEQKKKEQVVTKEVEKKSNGASTETHYDHIDPEVEGEPEAPPPPPPQPIEPGQQVNYGNKNVDLKLSEPKTEKIEISGEQNKINVSPKINLDPRKTV